MSNKEQLRAYIDSYGPLNLLKDLSAILHDLGVEWAEAGEKPISYAFSDSSNVIADVAERLERVEQNYAENIGGATREELVKQKAESEYKSLLEYFETLSLTDISKLYEKNKAELLSKLKRLEYLKRLIDKNNDQK
jgi:hypothetical protein